MPDNIDSFDRAQDILIRECRNGLASLSAAEADVYHVYRFLGDFENGGLSGYVYNLSPDFSSLGTLSALVRRLGYADLAADLFSVHNILVGGPTDFKGTWSDWLSATDPKDRLKQLDESIGSAYAVLWDELPKLTALLRK